MAGELPEGEVFEVETNEDVIDTDDGGAIVRLDEEQPETANSEDFYRNLAGDVDQVALESMTLELIRRIDSDKESRKKRDEQYQEGIKRTGLGDEAPGGAQFTGASKVVHPMLAKACVDFESRVIAELFPANGPVKDFIPGDPTKERLDKARRKTAYMNWQFKVQMPEFRAELEQLLTQLPLGGSQYLYLVWDHEKRRPVPAFWPIDDVYLPYAAGSFYTAERITMVERITQVEYERRVQAGLYRDLTEAASAPSTTPEGSKSQESSERVEGKTPDPYNEDGLRTIYKVYTWAGLEEDVRRPYVFEICATSHKTLSLVRNWEEDDQTAQPMFWLIEFPFIPWRGAYSVGLGQLIGSLSGAVTGALRALLDSAHANNLPTLLRLKQKGPNADGQSLSLEPMQITEIEGAIAGDPDIRKILMAVPFNPPSVVLLQMVGLLTQEGEGVVRTTFEDLTESGRPDMPVGTTLALIEQGMKVMKAIHQRLFDSMNRVVMILHRLNKMYLDEEELKDETGQVLAKRSDFEGPLDVIPVADPEIFSDVQRFAQVQMIAQRAAMLPMLYDLRKVEELILERTKLPEAKELLLPAPQPQEMNAVNENAAAAFGRPVAAFPEQDHLAHLQVHLDFMMSPLFGLLPTIAPRLLGLMLQHVSEHIVLWYVQHFFQTVKKETAVPFEELLKYRDPETRAELDRLLATASPDVMQDSQKVLNALPAVIQKAQQIMAQLAPQVPPDPRLAAEQIKAQTKREEIAAKREDKVIDLQKEREKQQNDMQREAMKQQSETERAERRNMTDTILTQAEIASKEKMNTQDNLTALSIANAEIESGEKIAVETGKGINPEPKKTPDKQAD